MEREDSFIETCEEKPVPEQFEKEVAMIKRRGYLMLSAEFWLESHRMRNITKNIRIFL